jgi:hypothetical protein
MHPPQNVDETPRPPQAFQTSTSQLEDPGDGNDAVRDISDAAISVESGTLVLKKYAARLLQAAMPQPEGMIRSDKPLPGNPFQEKGTFKNEHIIFNALTQGSWVLFDNLVAACGIAETNVKNKVRSMDSLAGYELKHDEPSNHYIMVLKQ